VRVEVQGLTPAESRQKMRTGRVVSDKMDKTVVVAVETLTRHPLYHKTIKRTKRFMAHDEGEVCRFGDLVRIVETRPLSRHKRWRVVDIISRGSLAAGEAPAGEKEAVDLARVPVADEKEALDAAPDSEVEVGE